MTATAHPGERAALRSNTVLLPASWFPANLRRIPRKQPFKLEHGPRETGTFAASSSCH